MSRIEYKIIYSRRRSVSISVSPHNGVIVRAPLKIPQNRIDKFVEEKSSWILKHLGKFSGSVLVNAGKKFTGGELHYYKGRQYTLLLIFSPKPYVRITENEVEAGLPTPDDPKKVKAMLEKWYLEEARRELSEKFGQVLEKFSSHGFKPSSLSLRATRSRLGSCSSKGRIMLSSELIKLDEKFHEYIIVHELCHLKHHNHGKGFYTLLEELQPDYREIRKELKRYVLTTPNSV